MDAQDMGDFISERRRDLGMSQADLANESGLSRNYIAIVERGEANNISTGALQKICTALGLGFEIKFFEPAKSEQRATC